MKYGLGESVIEKICAVLARFPAVEKAVLYGSRAKGNYKKGSDIDLTLYGDALTREQLAEIADALDDQLLPYTFDLSIFAELDHAGLREHIERIGVVFYERTTQRHDGWEVKILGEVCDILDSKRKPITKRDRTSGEYPYYGATGILDYVRDYIFDEKLILIGEDGAKWGSGENTAFAADGKYWVNNHAHVIRPNRKIILDNWIIYYLNFCDLSRYITGLTVPKLNQEKMRGIAIPLPPLAEQQRIVAILDETFAVIATAKENAEKNLQNARDVFDSHLQSIFTQRGEGWVEKCLEQIGTTQTGSTPKTSERENYGDFIAFIKPADFHTDGSLEYENDGLTKKGLSEARKVAAGSVLMVCIGATIGKCGYCDRDITTNQQINALTPFDGISNKFIYYQMLTENFQRRMLLSSAQATLPIINKSKWSALAVTLPPTPAEQKHIVTKLDSLATETQRLEFVYQQKLIALEELKKSILQKAFAGKLSEADTAPTKRALA